MAFSIGLTFARLFLHDVCLPWYHWPIKERKHDLSSPNAWRSAFNILQLAHGVAKADIARGVSRWTVLRRAVGFLWEWGDSLSAKANNLRLDVQQYSDFVASSLTGRIGQGLSILYCENQGFNYVGHYRAVVHSSIPKGPDFVVEKRDGGQAFVEAKASTLRVQARNEKRILTRQLREARSQIEAGFRACKRITMGYATAVLLRSLQDAHDSKAVVQLLTSNEAPEPNEGDAILRSNYAGWLALMHHLPLSQALMLREPSDVPRLRFSIVELARRDFALSPVTFLTWPIAAPLLIPVASLDYTRFAEGTAMRIDDPPVLAIGLEKTNLVYLASAAREGRQLSSARFERVEKPTPNQIEFTASIYDDSSILVILPYSRLLERFEEI